MKKRMVSLWFPTFATDRVSRHQAKSADWQANPLATIGPQHGSLCIIAANRLASEAGIHPGLSLAAARARVPALQTAATDIANDQRALAALADWCGGYTPWTAVDHDGDDRGGAGLWLDVSGCAHLFDGEATLLKKLSKRLNALGFANVAALADTPGAAWAMARFALTAINSTTDTIIPPGQGGQALAILPVAGLRLPSATTAMLGRLGLGRIGDLMALPRASLTARFGETLLKRLDQALGLIDESISPRRPVPAFRSRLAFAEPIAHTDDITRALRHLLTALHQQLEQAHQGARRLELTLYRTDGTRTGTAIGTSHPVRAPDHLARLFAEKLNDLDAGFGVEVITLDAIIVDPLAHTQGNLYSQNHEIQSHMACLIDRLGNRLGATRVMRLESRASHIPERACHEIPASAPSVPIKGKKPSQPRPVHLLPWPEPIEVMAPIPGHPPVLFRWRHKQYRISNADGPERIGPEWWLDALDPLSQEARSRDYYRIEDSEGRRFWLYREGLYRPDIQPRWYLHGFFA